MKKTLRTATFFGSGPVAAKSLELLDKWLSIGLVITKHTAPHHKDIAPVEEFAKKKNISIQYASTKKELDKLLYDHKLISTDYAIVIDYGVIISQAVIDFYYMGIINSHFSLLPEWRGADPITYSILSGQQKTGVSVMLIDSGMDTGPMLSAKEIYLNRKEDNSELTNILIKISDELLRSTLPQYLEGSIKPFEQPLNVATYSGKLNKPDGIINPMKPNTLIEREIRAYSVWPTSRYLQNGTWLTITKAHASSNNIALGRLVESNKRLFLGCKNGSIEILTLKPAGKANMPAKAFVNGYRHILDE